MEEKKVESTETVVHEFKNEPKMRKKSPLIIILVVLLGVGTGYLLSMSMNSKATTISESGEVVSDEVKKGSVVGSEDTETFNDTAEGVVKEGGIEGEGQYHLERPGGESQNVYMTSSIVDLSSFVDMKIKVWGSTQTAQTAGWLMDVGRVEVLE